jgi:hypothetical protein
MAGKNTRMYRLCFDPEADSPAGQGYIPTRDTCNSKSSIIGFGYELNPTRSIPRMGEGGFAGIGEQVQVDSDLRPEETRVPRPYNGIGVVRDNGSFVPLIREWEQPEPHRGHQHQV